jgi:hypothetical protein
MGEGQGEGTLSASNGERAGVRCRSLLPLRIAHQPSTHPPSTLRASERTIDLFLRLGIDLRRKNMSKRRHGFWRRFEGELDYLLADARAAFLKKIKLAHPDRGGCAEEATSLGLAWAGIQRRFARRGVRL